MGYPYPYFCLCAFLGPYMRVNRRVIIRLLLRIQKASREFGVRVQGFGLGVCPGGLKGARTGFECVATVSRYSP